MKHCLDDRFTLSSDKYNLILIEKISGKKDKRHYFHSIKLLSNFIVEYRLRECLVRGEIGLCNKSSLTPSYASVIEEAIGKLERYIDECINGKK
jgi:hypothetical protein